MTNSVLVINFHIKERLRSISFVSFGETAFCANTRNSFAFFNNLSKAINDSLCPAAVVESKEIQSILDSTELRIFIAQEKETLADAYLSQLIEKLRQKNVTIIFLSPIENYLSTSKLKTQLWRNIKSCVGSF